MVDMSSIVSKLNQQRTDLGLSCAAVAQRTGLALRTVQRVLSGQEQNPGFANVVAIAEALGVSIQLVSEDMNVMRQRQAERKAEKLMAMVQGTSGLEAQGLDAGALAAMKVVGTKLSTTFSKVGASL